MRQLYSFYFDAFQIAVKSIFEHKLRAFLTLIGIIIGVASVVVVGASISGLNSYVTEKIGKVLGTSGNTGAGGANVVKHKQLVEWLGSNGDSPFKPLPAKMRC